MKMVTFLRKMRKLLDDPKHWTKGSGARTAVGYICPATSKKATCWCLTGAVIKLYSPHSPHSHKIFESLNRQLHPRIKGHSPMERLQRFNDRIDRRHSDIIKLLDKAIEYESNH